LSGYHHPHEHTEPPSDLALRVQALESLLVEKGLVDPVANTPTVHNLVVCTLCSCYPWPVLGLPPVWYKSAPYRARAVADPRGVLREFGTELGDEVEIRVWDSTSEVRYLVLPEQPAGTEGWGEERLAGLVSRNAMIGVEKVRAPQEDGRNS